MSLPVEICTLRTRDLRELLEDEDGINHIIRCGQKFQRVQRAAEKLLLSNQQLAKFSLSQKPAFRDAKLLLAVKYKELGKLRSIIRAKQEQLAEKYSVHYTQWHLLRRISSKEEKCELLFQTFVEGKTPVADFLDSFIHARKLQHVSSVLLTKLQEVTELRSVQKLSETHTDTQRFSVAFPQQVYHTCFPVCSLSTAVVLPGCCHPLFLPPQCLQHFGPDYSESRSAGLQGRAAKWPVRPVRLQPLKVQQRRHQQAPQ